MTVLISLRTNDDGRLISSLDGQVLSATPLDALPSLKMLQADPLHIGKTLTAALGGAALLQRLKHDADNLLLLDCDARADAIGWEFAALDSHEFLAVQFGMLRLIDQTAPQLGDHTGSPLQFVFLGADPLVDEKGDARDGFRLGIENELRGIQRALKASGVALQAQRVPPTQPALQGALRRGPAILHLTCHGDIVPTDDGAMAVLHLEDENG
ncbi:MAG: hypothetical protein L0Y55_01420, partial [Anaerolineales bacterium]|nr:hypothetical protein [Anaerolineales bacterium]